MFTVINHSLKKSSHKTLRLPFLSRNISSSNLVYSSRAVVEKNEEFDQNKPIKFSISPGGFSLPTYKFSAYINDYPWWKEVILWGTFIFVVHYFMFFRQPNDIDEELDMPLGKRLLWMKEKQLMSEKNARLTKGLTTKSVDDDLEEIHKLKIKYKYI